MKPTINVLHLSTHDEECGIAVFQQNIVNAMGEKQKIRHDFFEISPNKLKLLRGAAFEEALQQLLNELQAFDILHIQHEYSFYYDDQLQRIVDGAKSLHKKVLFTLHTPPHARNEHHISARRGLHPRSWIQVLRVNRSKQHFLKSHIQPLLKADLLIVLSNASLESFAAYGVPRERMKVINLPIPGTDKLIRTELLEAKLHKQKGDIILSTIGFIGENKGVTATVKALNFLPSNYKLAIIGGVHPSGQNDKYFDKVCDLIVQYGLQERVYVSGFIAEDDERDALIRETDICLYPYDKRYYDYVSSGALTNAVSNDIPVLAYHTRTFDEINGLVPFINFCKSANYYEIARAVPLIDRQRSIALGKQYAAMFTVEKQAKLFAQVYQELLEQ